MTAASVSDGGWSVNRRAAKAVVWGAHDGEGRLLRDRGPGTLGCLDVDEARQLLDMLGLIAGYRGREILPDDTRVYALAALGCAGNDADEPPARHVDPGGPAGHVATTPAGLRNMPPGPLRPTAAPRRRPEAECGTPAGLRRHRNLQESSCEPCREAERVYQRNYRARRRAAAQPPPAAERPRRTSLPPEPLEPEPETPPPPTRGGRPRPPCGTRSGYQSHGRHGEQPCPACRDANAAAQRVYQEKCRARRTRERVAVELDVWFGAAQRSPHQVVLQAAGRAIAALLQLRVAMDDLARAERAAAARLSGVAR